MRKGLIRSPYIPKRTAITPTVVSVFDQYNQLVELLSRLSQKEDELEDKLAKAASLLNEASKKLSVAEDGVKKLTVLQDSVRFLKGKDADEDKIANRVLAAIPKPKDADEERVTKKVLSAIPKPKDGITPIVDYDKILKEVRVMVQDGKDAFIDYDALVETLKEKLTVDHIQGLRGEIDSYRNQLAGKVYGKDTWARGGGTTVSQGENITLVPLPDGTVQINAAGGGSGTNVTTQYSLAAVQAGDDVTIDLTQLTNWATYVNLIAVYRNNIPQTETINFTLSGSTLTIFQADASEIFNATYAYS